MMLPSLSLSSPASSAAVRVDKATSDFLMAPDWTTNMEICDYVNSDQGMAKEVVKAVKKRLQNKNPRVQMLTLTLLETLVKNCGDHIHFYIAEKKVLDEMIKIVKKRTDLQVRVKILVLLDSWQEAFGGPSGRHGQYYWAYDELRRSGVQFPQRSFDTAPIITPPATQPSPSSLPAIQGVPGNSSATLDEAMASNGEGLSVSEIGAVRNAAEFLADMLQAINPNDQTSVKDEVIVDLVDRCRTNQKRLVQMLGTTMDEELLAQGLELNDTLQGLLAKHDAIASGSPIPAHLTITVNPLPTESSASNVTLNGPRTEDSSSSTMAKPSTPSTDAMKARLVEEDEDEDEFALLAKRHSKASPVSTITEDATSSTSSNGSTFSAPSVPESSSNNALVPVDPPPPAKITNQQDMVDFLSIVLSTSVISEESSIPPTPNPAPPVADYSPNNVPQSTYSSYVVPWAQSQPHQQSQFYSQPSYPQQSSAYPPPPWAATPGFSTGRPVMPAHHPNPMPEDTKNVFASTQQPYNTGIGSLQPSNSVQDPQTANQQPFTSSSMAVDGPGGSGGQQRSGYVPSYRLFEDLNVFGNVEGKLRSGPYSSASGGSGQSMVGGRR